MLRFLTRLSGRRRHVCRSCGAPAPNSSSSSSSSSSSAAAAASSLPSPLPSPETLKLDCRLNHLQDKEDNYDVRLGCCYSRLRSHQLHDHHSHHHHRHHQGGYLDLDADNQSRQESSSSRHTASSDNRLLQDSSDDSLTRITGLRTTSTTIPTISSSKRDFT
ncbi:GSCOCG00009600001-RA-CDS, partial [Cotesia congregata]